MPNPVTTRKMARKNVQLGSKQAAQTRQRQKSFAKRARRLVWIFASLALVAFILGFFAFVESISVMRQPDLAAAAADGIVALTGGQNRLEAAASLFAEGKGARLLISGVNPSIDKKDLLKAVGGDPARFACCVDIDHDALETVGNAAQTAKWAKDHGFDEIILVTNNYHIPRSLLELRRAAPAIKIIPYPVVNSDLANWSWLKRPDTARVLFAEYLKYLGALSRAVLPVPVSIGAMLGAPAKN
jgi:uncharacterized SAM-binding protein YcdF (DUF218 family)